MRLGLSQRGQNLNTKGYWNRWPTKQVTVHVMFVPWTMLKLYIPVITLSLFQDYRFWYDYFTIIYKVYLLFLPSTSTIYVTSEVNN